MDHGEGEVTTLATIKAITLYQPWATLMAIGAKRIETRSWETRYRGLIAIHAGRNESEALAYYDEPFHKVLLEAGYHYLAMLPYGAVLAVGKLVNCIETDLICRGSVSPFSDQERAFGDYSPGRFGWLISDVRPLSEPIPCRGQRRLWDWELPEGFSL